jgi:D-hexose-6-phosphate mutarotase
MELEEQIGLYEKRFSFLNNVLASFFQVGDIKEIENTQLEISVCRTKLDELLKQQEDANRESEVPVG